MTSRRVFLRDGGLALVSLGFAPSFLARTAAASAARQKLLIAIFQRGAVDGLNMVVPYGERAYYKSRPTIAVPRPGGADAALDLDGFFAFHPRLAPLKPIYDRRELAVIHACGSPDHTRSHFDAQDYMESGTPGVKSTDDGLAEPDARGQARRDRPRPFARWRLRRRFRARCKAARRHWPSARSHSSASATDAEAWASARRLKRSTPRRPIRCCRRRAARRLTPSS